jgi:hypothetical protein
VYHLCTRSSSKPGGPAVTIGYRRVSDLRVASPCPRRKVACRPLELSVWAVTRSDARLAQPKEHRRPWACVRWSP